MLIAAIRLRARDLLKDVPGLSGVSSRPMERAPATFPYAFFGDARTERITPGNRESWVWIVPLSILVGRLANTDAELEQAENAMVAVQGTLRQNFTLGGLTDGVTLDSVVEGIVPYAGERYYGVTMNLRIHERHNVAYRP